MLHTYYNIVSLIRVKVEETARTMPYIDNEKAKSGCQLLGTKGLPAVIEFALILPLRCGLFLLQLLLQGPFE
jgi:hypothetical protein